MRKLSLFLALPLALLTAHDLLAVGPKGGDKKEAAEARLTALRNSHVKRLTDAEIIYRKLEKNTGLPAALLKFKEQAQAALKAARIGCQPKKGDATDYWPTPQCAALVLAAESAVLSFQEGKSQQAIAPKL